MLTGVVPVKPPKVVKPRKVRANPNAKHDTNRAQLLLALTTTPQDYRQLARATGLPVHTVKNCLSNMVDKGLAKPREIGPARATRCRSLRCRLMQRDGAMSETIHYTSHEALKHGVRRAK